MEKTRGKIRTKILAAVLLLLTAAACVGCGRGGEAAEGETTELFAGAYNMSPAGVLRFDDRGYLQFYSRESDQTVYLCNQAGCTHRDKNCSAYVEGCQTAFYFRNSLYLVQLLESGTQIMRANRFGEDRQILTQTDVNLLHFAMRIEGETLYFIGNRWEYEGEKSIQNLGLYALNLEDGTLTALSGQDTGYRISDLADFWITDRYIYTEYSASDTDINDFFDAATGQLREIDWDSVVYTYLLYRTDRQTGETKLVLQEEGGDEVGLSVLEAGGEGFIVKLNNHILRYEGEKEPEVLYTYPCPEDKTYWVAKSAPGGYLAWDYTAAHEYHVLKDFKETDTFAEGEGETVYYLGFAGDRLYFNGNSTLYYMEEKDFREGNYRFHLIEID